MQPLDYGATIEPLSNFAHDLELLCTAYKVPVDVGLKFGNAYTELISDKSGNDGEGRGPKPRLREILPGIP